MNYTKVKNYIYITLNKSTDSYCFDINTGIFYGIFYGSIGRPLNICPKGDEIRKLFDPKATNLDKVLNRMFRYNYKTEGFLRYTSAIQTAEKLDALGIPPLTIAPRDYEYIGEHFKAFCTYYNIYAENFDLWNFHKWVALEEAKNIL